MQVDENFMKALTTGAVDKTALLASMVPTRAWFPEKLDRFLAKLIDQAAGEKDD